MESIRVVLICESTNDFANFCEGLSNKHFNNPEGVTYVINHLGKEYNVLLINGDKSVDADMHVKIDMSDNDITFSIYGGKVYEVAEEPIFVIESIINARRIKWIRCNVFNKKHYFKLLKKLVEYETTWYTRKVYEYKGMMFKLCRDDGPCEKIEIDIYAQGFDIKMAGKFQASYNVDSVSTVEFFDTLYDLCTPKPASAVEPASAVNSAPRTEFCINRGAYMVSVYDKYTVSFESDRVDITAPSLIAKLGNTTFTTQNALITVTTELICIEPR